VSGGAVSAAREATAVVCIKDSFYGTGGPIVTALAARTYELAAPAPGREWIDTSHVRRVDSAAMSSRAASRGFSLVELMVLLAILVILASIFVPFLLRARETDRRVRCTDNLRAIQQALKMYATANGNNMPRVIHEPSRSPTGYVAWTGRDSSDAFTRGSNVRANDVTASLWLLVRGGLVSPARFVCPSTDDEIDPGVPSSAYANFTGPKHLSYSYASPFSAAPGYRLNTDLLKFDFAVVADKNPGTGGGDRVTGPAYNAGAFALAKANSNNHGRAGQNVLYADGHVSFQPTPYCGVGEGAVRDNIYTALSATPLPDGSEPTLPAVAGKGVVARDIGPAWAGDSFLLPTDDE
jgi:prepilin-type N-terminal cleavage/methylation domain-containing protein/prepilin-type processing-associated H-X9-DG protein